MEFLTGIVLPVAIIIMSIFHSKGVNPEEKQSYKEPQVGIVEEVVSQEPSKSKTEKEPTKKRAQQRIEVANSLSVTHNTMGIVKGAEGSKGFASSQEIRIAQTEDKKPFKHSIDVIEGTINHYVSIEITPSSDRSVVEIRQKVEKLSLMSEFVKVRAYISKQPKIYEEYGIPPVEYRNNTVIIRFPIDKRYEFYQFQYSVKGLFEEPEVAHVR